MLDDLKNKVTGNMKDIGESVGFNLFSKEKADMLARAQKKYKLRSLRGWLAYYGGLIIFLGLSVLAIAFNWITILISIVFTIVGLILIIIELTRMPMYKRLPNYFACIADSKNGSLDAISASLGYPYETVVSDIEFLINRGILEKTYINHSRRLITSPLIGEVILQDARRVLCPNCGATNEIIGQTKECDFCGTVLQ
ncbi:hypothetical protein [Streptococcus sp. cx1]|uniref:hypothetical protein n=1 Tax=Streptococcus sp. cx1 TaxID=3458240 RepID=UPI000FF2AE5C|nr:hypothetical protein DWV94_02790 [Streptococcus salivarius]